MSDGVQIAGLLLVLGIVYAAVNYEAPKICTDHERAYLAVQQFLKKANGSYEFPDISEVRFDEMSGCRMRVTSYALIPDNMGRNEKDKFSLMVARVQGESEDTLEVDLVATLQQ